MAWRGSQGATSASAATTLTVTLPVTANAGDIIILSISSGGSSALTFSCPTYLTIASAVAALSNIAYTIAAGTFGALYKVAAGGETAATVTKSGSADFMAIQANVFSGRNTSAPFTAGSSAGSTGGSSPTSIPCGTITAAAGDDLLYMTGEGNNVSNTSPTLTAPSGFSNVLNTFSAVSFVPGANSANNVNFNSGAGGATGTVTGTITFTGGANNDSGGFLLSLAAASGGASIPAPMYHRKNILYFI